VNGGDTIPMTANQALHRIAALLRFCTSRMASVGPLAVRAER